MEGSLYREFLFVYLCPGGSMPRGVSVQGGLCHGVVEERAVCILLECILVGHNCQ